MRKLAFAASSLFLAAHLDAATSLHLDLPQAIDPGLPFPITLTVLHNGAAAATGVKVTVDLRDAAGVRLPDECRTTSPAQVVCDFGTIERRSEVAEGRRSVAFEIVAPDRLGITVGISAQLDTNEGGGDPRLTRRDTFVPIYDTFTVSNTADSGPGSLRDAMNAATPQRCSAGSLCKIAFRIPPNGAKWLTIRPLMPLPALTGARVTVDGASQSRYFGDTNPDGPEIEISGASLSAGDGLVVGSCGNVTELVVNGFPGEGIVVTDLSPCSSASISGCYLGTDPTGSTAVPNERGIMVRAIIREVRDSVISGNRRSGVYVADSGRANISRNVIGLNAARTAGLGNGASGVYIARGGRGSDVRNNYIGFNHHAGVSIATDAWWVRLQGNSFQANWGLAIDYGLDGVTRTMPFVGLGPGGRFLGDPGSFRYPTIVSAVYDSKTDTTTLEATVEASRLPAFYDSYFVGFYANDEPDPSGFGEGQYYLGYVSSRSDRFVLELKGRPPGPWISATTTAWAYFGFARPPEIDDAESGGDYGSTYSTSEFSRTVRVTER